MFMRGVWDMGEIVFVIVLVLIKYIKWKFDVDFYFENIWIKGELLNVKIYIRGYIYFILKDENVRM